MLRRRTFLVGALAAVSAGPRVFDKLLASGASGQEPTIAALVDAVIDRSDAHAAARRIAAELETALPTRRAAIDELLAALENERFAEATKAQRLQLLRAWADDPAKLHLADRAVALAASGVGPAGADYRSLPVSI
jgi:hypothetical protein